MSEAALRHFFEDFSRDHILPRGPMAGACFDARRRSRTCRLRPVASGNAAMTSRPGKFDMPAMFAKGKVEALNWEIKR
ncbi:hypothetical protein ACTGJ9_007100 [Bradyrhizobium sp. RDM12]